MSEITNIENKPITETTNIGEVIENESKNKKVKYKKPFVMTEKRKEAVEKMKAARKEHIADKKSKAQKTVESLTEEIKQLTEKLGKVESSINPTNEIIVNRPQKVEKEHKKEIHYDEFKNEILSIKEMLKENLKPNEKPASINSQEVANSIIYKPEPVIIQKRSLYGIEF